MSDALSLGCLLWLIGIVLVWATASGVNGRLMPIPLSVLSFPILIGAAWLVQAVGQRMLTRPDHR